MNILSQVEPMRPADSGSRSLPTFGHRGQALLVHAWSALKWIMQRAKAQQSRKNLRVCETISLGEKRFVAVLQVDQERFLIGGSSSEVSLLTRLQHTETFAAALEHEAVKTS